MVQPMSVSAIGSKGKVGRYFFSTNWASESGSTTGHDKWEKHSGGIPKAIRDKITEVISTNLRSPNPMPLVLKVGENVDGTHDLKVRLFTHNGHMHIGLHMLCPNSSLK